MKKKKKKKVLCKSFLQVATILHQIQKRKRAIVISKNASMHAQHRMEDQEYIVIPTHGTITTVAHPYPGEEMLRFVLCW